MIKPVVKLQTSSDDRWSELMRLGQQGDKAAYETLLFEVKNLIRGYLRKRVSSDTLIEDLTQEVLLAVHSGRHTYDPSRSFRGWLMAITRNRLIDYWRGEQRRIGSIEQGTELDLKGECALTALSCDVKEIVATLSPKQQELFFLARVEGLTMHEVAEKSDSTEGAVKVALHRIMKVIKQHLLES